MDIKCQLYRIKQRYFRPVIACSTGIVTHFGDCKIYTHSKVCTCGLHMDLDVLQNEQLAKILDNKYMGYYNFEVVNNEENYEIIREIFGQEYVEYLYKQGNIII